MGLRGIGLRGIGLSFIGLSLWTQLIGILDPV